MRVKSLAAIAGLAAALLGASAAAAEPVVAKLQTPVPSATKPVAGGAVFECLGDVCAARSPSADTAELRGCRDLVRQVGPVSAFGPASKPMSPDALSACNSAAKH
jgi:hypothetical protein